MTSTNTEDRPKVVILNRSFWPDSEATGQLLAELAVDLSKWLDVTVIVGRPNHIDSSVQDNYEEIDNYHGVRICRVWHTRFSKHSLPGRFCNLLTFALSASRAAGRLEQAPDAIVVETDPFFLPLIGRRIQRRFPRASLICYLQDLYPDVAVAVGKIREGFIATTVRQMLFNVYRQASRVIVLSRDMQERCEHHGVPGSTLEVIANWCDVETVKPAKVDNAFRRRFGLENKFVVMYSGNMGLAHDLDAIVGAADLLRDRTNIEWVFVGDGARRRSLEARVKELDLANVRFLPYQPRNELGQSLSAADVHVVSIRTGAEACVMPSKIYGILASATPAIAMAGAASELCQLINDHDIGFTCNPGDAQSLARFIAELAANSEVVQRMGQNARSLARSKFNRSRQTARVAESIYRTIHRDVPAEVLSLALAAEREMDCADSISSAALVQ